MDKNSRVKTAWMRNLSKLAYERTDSSPRYPLEGHFLLPESLLSVLQPFYCESGMKRGVVSTVRDGVCAHCGDLELEVNQVMRVDETLIVYDICNQCGVANRIMEVDESYG